MFAKRPLRFSVTVTEGGKEPYTATKMNQTATESQTARW